MTGARTIPLHEVHWKMLSELTKEMNKAMPGQHMSVDQVLGEGIREMYEKRFGEGATPKGD